MPQKLHNRKPLEENRKVLRKNLTPSEAVLWKAIQKGKLDGRKFRRQHSVGNYVLDFYCPEERLCIELDGAYHFTLTGTEKDHQRTEYLKSLFIKVIRFENKFVFEHLDWVIDEIRKQFTSAAIAK